MIRDGATLVESIEHILEALRGWQAPTVESRAAAPAASVEHPLLDLLHAAPHSTEALVQASGWPLAQVLAALTELELDGLVCNEAGRWLARSR